MQLFHMPNENNGKWQAAFHNFGCSPEFGEPEMEYIILSVPILTTATVLSI